MQRLGRLGLGCHVSTTTSRGKDRTIFDRNTEEDPHLTARNSLTSPGGRSVKTAAEMWASASSRAHDTSPVSARTCETVRSSVCTTSRGEILPDLVCARAKRGWDGKVEEGIYTVARSKSGVSIS